MKRLISGSRLRQLTHVRAAALLVAGLALFAAAAASAAPQVDWPSFKEQTEKDHVTPGSNLERLIAENQDFGLLRPEETRDSLRIPLWLRVLWRKNHPDDRYSPQDPTGGYPLVLNEVHEWMLSHQDLKPGKIPPLGPATKSASETGEERISGAQTSPRSESAIRVNYVNPQKIIGASNNISSTGRQAMFFSSNAGSTWGQTLLPLVTGDSFMSDPTVDWTSDGTAWSTTIGIDSTQTILKMRAYKSTDGGATWTFDADFSGGNTNNDKQMMWTDHSATSPFKDNIYLIWHPGTPAVVARRTGPTGSWQAPVQVSHAETTGTAIGADIKTNANGDVFGFYPDTGSRGIYVVKSTNGGVSFGTPVKIATSFGSFQIAIPADASRQLLIYTAAGAFSDGTRNNVYVVWNDLSGDSGCTSGGGPGTNAASTCKTRIFFSRSTNGGSTWSAPVKINNQSGLNDQFFPWLVVDPTSARISLVYYDTVGDSTRKSVNLYYQSSTDDGVTWSAPFKVTTASTNETTAGADSGNQFGDYINLDGINGTFFPSWTDRRSGASEEIWTAAILDSTTGPDFSITTSPSSTSIAQGGSGNVTVSTTVSGGFNNAIALSASGQPAGVTVAFNPTSIAAPGSGSSTMTITVSSSATAGTSTITVTGTGGSTTHNTSVVLTVTSAGGSSLTNGGFETGNFTGWTTAGVTSVIAGAAHSGNFGAQIGSTSASTDSSAAQTFTLPAGSPTIAFWYNNHCPDTLTFDWATVTLLDNVTSTTTTLLPKTCTTTGVWTQVTYNAIANAGHSVTLTLANHDDNFAGDPTFTWYDDVTVTSGTDTTPPTTSITAPANGATVSGTVNVTASASDNVGVVKVEFYIDSVLKSTVTTSPYTFSWNTTTVANGSHTIFSKAYDAANNVGTSATVTVTVSNTVDTTPPTTSITAPANGATVSGTVNVTASASDNVGVVKVEFYIDSVLKSTVTTSPYTFSWNTTTVANGSHTIFSKAYDAANNVGTSATVTVTVSNSTAQQLLGNPGFETGTAAPWTTTAGVINNSASEPPHSGSWDGWMDGYGTTHTDTVMQQVAIPANITTATLTFWLHVDTAETTTTTAFDTLQVQIRNSSGTVLATLATYSNLSHNTGYAQKSFDVSAYKGQTIQVFLVGTEDASLQTSFVVDDFALNVQ